MAAGEVATGAMAPELGGPSCPTQQSGYGPSMSSRYAVAQRANVPPFHVMDLLAAADQRRRTHGDLVNLVAGQPSTGAPGAGEGRGDPAAPVRRPARLHRRAGHHRAARADRRTTTGSATASTSTADEVIVTTGSSGGFLLAFLAAFEPGDRVAMARPGYPCYRNVLTALGCEVVELPCGPETRFQPTVAQLERGPGPQGRRRRQPGQPDRHHAAARGAVRRSRPGASAAACS